MVRRRLLCEVVAFPVGMLERRMTVHLQLRGRRDTRTDVSRRAWVSTQGHIVSALALTSAAMSLQGNWYGMYRYGMYTSLSFGTMC
jgi:hypothetical protein